MPARVEVVVETKSIGGGVLRALTSELGSFGNLIQEVTAKNINWGNVAELATTMVINGLKDSIEETQKYAGEIRDLSAISGQSAEETSRFVQVLDDYQLTAQDAEAVTRKLTANGLTPNLETLASLSDQYLAINGEAERNKFIIDNLGRSGLQWVNVLKQGGAALREQGAAVSQNLILNQETLRQTEEYRLALDAWSDAVMGVKIAIGSHLIPALTELISAEAAATAQEQRWNEARIQGGNMSRASYGIEQQHIKTVNEASAAADSATRSYIAMAKGLSSQTNPALEATDARFKDVISNAIQLGAVTDENIKKAAFNTLQLKLASDGIISPEDEAMLEEAGVAFGVIDEKSLRATKTINQFVNQVDAGTLSIKQFVAAVNTIPGAINLNVIPPGAGSAYGPGTGEQVGGPVYAGGSYNVFERGREPFVPAMNGRILGNAESMAMMARNSGGGSNYFYGPVTIEAGSGAGGDLLTMR